jgi:hypothetical protein
VLSQPVIEVNLNHQNARRANVLFSKKRDRVPAHCNEADAYQPYRRPIAARPSAACITLWQKKKKQ